LLSFHTDLMKTTLSGRLLTPKATANFVSAVHHERNMRRWHRRLVIKEDEWDEENAAVAAGSSSSSSSPASPAPALSLSASPSAAGGAGSVSARQTVVLPARTLHEFWARWLPQKEAKMDHIRNMQHSNGVKLRHFMRQPLTSTMTTIISSFTAPQQTHIKLAIEFEHQVRDFMTVMGRPYTYGPADETPRQFRDRFGIEQHDGWSVLDGELPTTREMMEVCGDGLSVDGLAAVNAYLVSVDGGRHWAAAMFRYALKAEMLFGRLKRDYPLAATARLRPRPTRAGLGAAGAPAAAPVKKA